MQLLAYIDAGSGTMLVQVILAGIVAVPFFFRQAISNGWRRLRGSSARESTPSTNDRED